MLRGLVDDLTARVRLTMLWTAIAGVAAVRSDNREMKSIRFSMSFSPIQSRVLDSDYAFVRQWYQRVWGRSRIRKCSYLYPGCRPPHVVRRA